MTSLWLPALLALPWVSGLLCVLLRGAAQRAARLLALGAMAALAVGLVGAGGALSGVLAFQTPWIPSLGVRFALRLDSLSWPMMVNLIIVSLGATWYAWGYWTHVDRPHLAYALLLAFVGSMVGTLLADDVILFFVFWECMLVASSLVLAGWGQGSEVGRVTLRYFLFTQAGSLLLLAGLVWATMAAGTTDMTDVATALSGLPIQQLRWLALLMFLGFSVKLAVVPVHLWLPDAHAVAPMPITILLAAAMLSMGAYGMLRFPLAMLPEAALGPLRLPLLLVALLSQFYGALMCLSVSDIKRIVAYSSVSQMGYILLGMASLTHPGVQGSVMHVINHGLLKSALFMAVGVVMQATGRRQIGSLGGLARSLPAMAAVFFLGAVAMAGLPPFVNFYSEWLILLGGLSSGYPVLGYLAFLSPVLTAAYGIWLCGRLAFGDPQPASLEAIPTSMRWSCYAMLALALGLGLFPDALSRWSSAASDLVLRGSGG